MVVYALFACVLYLTEPRPPSPHANTLPREDLGSNNPTFLRRESVARKSPEFDVFLATADYTVRLIGIELAVENLKLSNVIAIELGRHLILQYVHWIEHVNH